jgi:hypothetical protein
MQNRNDARRRHLSKPDNEMPGSVAVDALLASSEDLAVFICGMSVYRNGVDFTVEVRARPGRMSRESLHEAMLWPDAGENQLLLGIEFADGRRCANIPREHPPPRWRRWRAKWKAGATSADQPALWSSGSGGSFRSAYATWYLSALPPPGDLRIICAWPAAGVPETITTLSADAILEAASHARELWPWEPEPQIIEREPGPPDIPDDGWFAEHLPPIPDR